MAQGLVLEIVRNVKTALENLDSMIELGTKAPAFGRAYQNGKRLRPLQLILGGR